MKSSRINFTISEKDKQELIQRAKDKKISVGRLIRLEMLTDYTQL